MFGYRAVCPEFRVWKTIKLGTGLRTADDFRRALKGDGHEITLLADDLLGNPVFVVAAEQAEVHLLDISAAELGFEHGATRKHIYDRAAQLGLVLCLPEVGPQLRLQYKDQSLGPLGLGERLSIAMEPIHYYEDGLFVFEVERLLADCGMPDSWFAARDVHLDDDDPGEGWDRWVFVLPSPSSVLLALGTLDLV